MLSKSSRLGVLFWRKGYGRGGERVTGIVLGLGTAVHLGQLAAAVGCNSGGTTAGGEGVDEGEAGQPRRRLGTS